jgi:hypothetical protein
VRFLFVVLSIAAVVWVARHPRERRTAVAMVRSGAVLVNLAASDYATLQHQVLFGARRRRCVAVNGVVRLPTTFDVTFASSDRPLVEPVERGFFADISEVLLADADQEGWIVDGVPSFRAIYSERGRPGFPSVAAVGPPFGIPLTDEELPRTHPAPDLSFVRRR